MPQKRVLVTGGMGFLGRYIVRELLHQGHRVRILDLKKPDQHFIPFLREKTSALDTLETREASIMDPSQLHRAMEGIDEVYHLAAIPHLWAQDPKIFEHINYEGTLQVLDKAREFSINKLVYTSTEAILGNFRQPSQDLIHEETPLPDLGEMAGPYTRSKWKAEQEVRSRALAGDPLVIVYPTTPMGAHDWSLTPPTRMIRDFLRGRTPAYLECHLNLIAAEDVALGHLRAMERGKTGDRFILGNANLSLSKILDILAHCSPKKMPTQKIPYWLAQYSAELSQFWSDKISGKAPMASREGVKLARAYLLFDNSRMREELGIQPIPVEKAIWEVARWILENDI